MGTIVEAQRPIGRVVKLPLLMKKFRFFAFGHPKFLEHHSFVTKNFNLLTTISILEDQTFVLDRYHSFSWAPYFQILRSNT